jgi:hypothetical protein
MRRYPLILIATALLLTPAVARASKVPYTGRSTRDAATVISFEAVGQRKIGRHGVVVPKKVTNIAVTNVFYQCGGPGIPSTGTLRSDLPFSSIGPLKVDKRGSFSGTGSPPGVAGGRFSITGSFRKGRASGSFVGSEGPSAAGLTCTTGGHRWTAAPAD